MLSPNIRNYIDRAGDGGRAITMDKHHWRPYAYEYLIFVGLFCA